MVRRYVALPSQLFCEPARRREQPPKERKREEEHGDRESQEEDPVERPGIHGEKVSGVGGIVPDRLARARRIRVATAWVTNLVDLARTGSVGVDVIIAIDSSRSTIVICFLPATRSSCRDMRGRLHPGQACLQTRKILQCG